MDRNRRPSKAIRRKLRELRDLAYNRELTACLEELYQSFGRWKAGEIDCWELNERIHEHHEGASKELFQRYTSFKPDMAVICGIAAQVLEPSELPESEREELVSRGEQLREIWET